jgi:hypothetical protein
MLTRVIKYLFVNLEGSQIPGKIENYSMSLTLTSVGPTAKTIRAAIGGKPELDNDPAEEGPIRKRKSRLVR